MKSTHAPTGRSCHIALTQAEVIPPYPSLKSRMILHCKKSNAKKNLGTMTNQIIAWL